MYQLCYTRKSKFNIVHVKFEFRYSENTVDTIKLPQTIALDDKQSTSIFIVFGIIMTRLNSVGCSYHHYYFMALGPGAGISATLPTITTFRPQFTERPEMS